MRRSLAAISLAVTSLVAVAFLVPLAVVVSQTVHQRVVADAFRSAAAMGSVLAVTTRREAVARAVAGTPAGSAGRMTVYLPGYPDGGPATVVGRGRAPADRVADAQRQRRSFSTPLPDGLAVLQPVILDQGRLAVVEVDVPEAALHQGVWRARLILAGLAVVLVGGSVALADRLATRVVRAAGELSVAAARLGSGELEVRITPQGPAELREAARAFNTMADQVASLLAAERELAADLSHRLRTPLTGLVMASRSLGDGVAAGQVRAVTATLEAEIDGIILRARRSRTWRPRRCEVIAVLRDRLDFWGALADDEGRSWRLVAPSGPIKLPVAGDDLVAALDALLGNIFQHTPQGAPFEVEVTLTGGMVTISVADGGPGIPDPQQALLRGTSGAGSTGLGLDIAGRLARDAGGGLRITRSAAGGARVDLHLPAGGRAAEPPRRLRRRRGRK